MRARLFTYWEKLHTSFWFIPMLMITAALVLSCITIEMDHRIDERWVAELPFTFKDGVEGSRNLLAAVISSMITVTGVTFSVTIVAFTLASTQFTPRLLRNFMRDYGNQVVLGIFIATFFYCLLILRVVGGRDGDFIPRVSVSCALAMTTASVCALIYFVHHASALIQAQAIIAEVARELERSLNLLYPREIGRGQREVANPETLPPDFEVQAVCVGSERNDYLEALDGAGLLGMAEELDLQISLERRPGDFIGKGEVIARVFPSDRASDEVCARVRNSFIFGPERTQTQDAEFVLNELVEIAVRALSPGINDPATAILCVDRIGAALAGIADREPPSSHRYDEKGRLRIVARKHSFEGLVGAAFNPIRQYARNSVAVTIRLLEALRLIALNTHREEDRKILARHAEMIERGSKAALSEPYDQECVAERVAALLPLLSSPAPKAAERIT
jgi:uncharacterized membrane protein